MIFNPYLLLTIILLYTRSQNGREIPSQHLHTMSSQWGPFTLLPPAPFPSTFVAKNGQTAVINVC